MNYWVRPLPQNIRHLRKIQPGSEKAKGQEMKKYIYIN